MDRFVIMGVSGCGKSSVGAGFAQAIGATFIDGDDLHPESNIAKMAAGHPLTDEDRWPWLIRVGQTLQTSAGPVVLGCSALKRRYRDKIRESAGSDVCFLHLAGAKSVIAARMQARAGHFMPPALLDSQFAALEPPEPDETSFTVDIDQPTDQVVAALVAYFAKEAT
ncbi:MAG: gluconokinase [Cypionkella sp.]